MATDPPPDTPEAPAAPLVTVVVVTRDAGPWLEASLTSIREQEYPDLRFLVVDAGSREDPRERVEGVLPSAELRRADAELGFAAANAVLEDDESLFFVFCHDDIRLEPDALRLLVEEAFRSNAGVVGPKLVDWHDAGHLRQVGMSADKAGVPVTLVEPGELDQQQHDSVRDVFFVPGGCTLVRADLFRALGGFDPEMPLFGEDLDLSWRAHVAGARVMVAPGAVAGHLEAFRERAVAADPGALTARHRIRSLLSCYAPWHLFRVVPQALLFTAIEVLASLLTGRTGRARGALGAWTWNLQHLGDLRRRRSELHRLRRVKDGEIRHLQVRGSAQLSTLVRARAAADQHRSRGVVGVGRTLVDRLREPDARRALLVWSAVLFVLVVGGRHLLTRPIANVGELVDLGESASSLAEEYGSAFRDSGVGVEAPAPTALGLMSILGALTWGNLPLLRTVLLLAPIPVGLLGMSRLLRPAASARARLVAVVAYGALPVGFNALGEAHWSGLVLYAAAPLLVARLARLSGWAPYVPGDRADPWRRQVIALGVTVALASFLVPVVALLVPLMAIGLVLGSLLVGQPQGVGRLLAGSVLGAVTGLVVQLPWSADVITGGWDSFGRPRQSPFSVLDLGDLLRFRSGEVGGSVFGSALLVAALLALLIGRDWRLAWAVRGWMMAITAWAVALGGQHGWLPFDLPPVEVVLAPAAVGVAVAISMGMVAFEMDLPDYHFGWRQLGSLVAGLALVLGTLPILAEALVDGRWGAPKRDLDTVLGFLGEDQEEGAFRVLWIGDPDALPLSGWSFGDGVAYALTSRGLPRLGDLFPVDSEGPNAAVGAALESAASGESVRLGEDLAPLGVRYIVMPLSKDPDATEATVPQARVVQALPEQLDLAEITAGGEVEVWENDAWEPPDIPQRTGFTAYRGEVPSDTTVVHGSGGSGWRLRVDGDPLAREEVSGWASSWEVIEGGEGRLGYESSPLRTVWILLGTMAWIVVAWMLRPSARREETEDHSTGEAG